MIKKLRLPLMTFPLFLLLLISGCSLPKPMHIATLDNPENVDKDVRFRTDYYLFTLRSCPDDSTEIESLQRFRLLGKSDAFWNKVFFESGFVPKDEIERLSQYALTKGLGEGYKKEDKERDGAGISKEDLTEMKTSILSKIDSKGNEILNKPAKPIKIEEKNKKCPRNTTTQKYFLLGPHGLKEVRQDSLLVFALTIDAKPLLDSLKDPLNKLGYPLEEAPFTSLKRSAEVNKLLKAQNYLLRYSKKSVDCSGGKSKSEGCVEHLTGNIRKQLGLGQGNAQLKSLLEKGVKQVQ
ncbi:hypothetical protein ACQZV8_06420 [Magnetococcales bacterium HHB-1]